MRKFVYLYVSSMLLAFGQSSQAQSTIFNYQGRLNVNGVAANGLYDFQFTIYKTLTNGVVIAGPVTNAAVGVTNGLFITSLDLGNQPFLGVNRWLDIAVRSNGTSAAFTTLPPRTRIASAPYAIAAANIIDGGVTASSLSPGPGADGQVLKMSGGVLAWGNLTSTGAITSVGTGLGLLGGPITNSGTVSIDPSVVPLLANSQTFTGSNTFRGVTTLSNANNRFIGTFIGNGAGLTNLALTNTSVTLSGDVTGPSTASTVARIRGVNVSSTAPATSQLLRFDGANWTPSAVALGTDVSGMLALASGGTAAGTAAGARGNLGAASSGANSDITSLAGLSTPLSAAQGGSGQASYTIGDILYASAPATLARLPDVPTGNALISGGTASTPSWGKIGLSTHVTGTLSVTNGGTGASTPGTGRAALGAAASGANADITALSGLTTPLSPAEGGSGQSAYSAGDLLYAPAANSLARRPIGAETHVLSVSNGLPVWEPANNHDHFGQVWAGIATDGLFLQNTSTVAGASALTGFATAPGGQTFGVFGQSASTNGTGVEGFAFASTGNSMGVYGESTSTNGTGVFGVGSAVTGVPVGVYGESDAPLGIGVYGLGASTATSGIPVGVYGQVYGPGYGLYTPDALYVGGQASLIGPLYINTLSIISTNASPTNGLFSPSINTVAVSTSGIERLRVASDGKVGVGRIATTNIFEVEGNASKTVAGSWLANSDARIKTDVKNLEHSLETIDRLRPVSFHYTEEYRAAHPSIENKTYLNVIAQEYGAVFPDAVRPSGEMLDGKPILQVDTHPAMIHALAAIQELHRLVKARDEEVVQLKAQNASLERRLEALEKAVALGLVH